MTRWWPTDLGNSCLHFLLLFTTGIPNPQTRVFVLDCRKLLNFSEQQVGKKVSFLSTANEEAGFGHSKVGALNSFPMVTSSI